MVHADSFLAAVVADPEPGLHAGHNLRSLSAADHFRRFFFSLIDQDSGILFKYTQKPDRLLT